MYVERFGYFVPVCFCVCEREIGAIQSFPYFGDGFFSNLKIPIWVNFEGPEIGKC
jgi:hypothetical protein